MPLKLDFDAPIYPAGSKDAPPGAIMELSNDQLSQTFFSESVTGYIAGIPDYDGVRELIDYLFPPRQVGMRFEYRTWTDSQYLVDTNDVRAYGGSFKVIESTGAMETGKLYNRGLTMKVDYDDVRDQPNWENETAEYLSRFIDRNTLVNGVNMLSTASEAGAVTKTWDGATDKNPDGDLLSALAATKKNKKIRPNYAICDADAWTKRLNTYSVQNTAGATAGLMRNLAGLASFLSLREMRMSDAIYQSSATETANIFPSAVIMFYKSPGATRFDPTTAMRFWNTCVDGGERRVYIERKDKVAFVTVEKYDRLMVLMPSGLTKVKIA